MMCSASPSLAQCRQASPYPQSWRAPQRNHCYDRSWRYGLGCGARLLVRSRLQESAAGRPDADICVASTTSQFSAGSLRREDLVEQKSQTPFTAVRSANAAGNDSPGAGYRPAQVLRHLYREWAPSNPARSSVSSSRDAPGCRWAGSARRRAQIRTVARPTKPQPSAPGRSALPLLGAKAYRQRAEYQPARVRAAARKRRTPRAPPLFAGNRR